MRTCVAYARPCAVLFMLIVTAGCRGDRNAFEGRGGDFVVTAFSLSARPQANDCIGYEISARSLVSGIIYQGSRIVDTFAGNVDAVEKGYLGDFRGAFRALSDETPTAVVYGFTQDMKVNIEAGEDIVTGAFPPCNFVPSP